MVIVARRPVENREMHMHVALGQRSEPAENCQQLSHSPERAANPYALLPRLILSNCLTAFWLQTSAMPVSRLPDEILSRIFAHVDSEDGKSRLRTLRMLALTSKRIKRLSTPYLFRTLTDKQMRSGLIGSAIMSRSAVRTAVREVEWQMFSNVELFRLADDEEGSVEDHQDRRSTFSERRMAMLQMQASVASFASRLQALPMLSTLIIRLGLDSEAWADTHANLKLWTPSADLILFPAISNLRRLELHSIPTQWLGDWSLIAFGSVINGASSLVNLVLRDVVLDSLQLEDPFQSLDRLESLTYRNTATTEDPDVVVDRVFVTALAKGLPNLSSLVINMNHESTWPRNTNAALLQALGCLGLCLPSFKGLRTLALEDCVLGTQTSQDMQAFLSHFPLLEEFCLKVEASMTPPPANCDWELDGLALALPALKRLEISLTFFLHDRNTASSIYCTLLSKLQALLSDWTNLESLRLNIHYDGTMQIHFLRLALSRQQAEQTQRQIAGSVFLGSLLALRNAAQHVPEVRFTMQNNLNHRVTIGRHNAIIFDPPLH